MKKYLLVLLIILASIINIPVYAKDTPNDIKIESKKIEYNLPYPGLLPDHPLYSLKKIRDTFWIFITRDNLKKANVYHLISDKKAYAALMLSEKGKWNLAIETIQQGENDFIDAIKYYNLAKQQGSSPQQDTVLNLKLSAEKHREISENLLKKSPKNNSQQIQSVLKINKQVSQKLDKL